MKALRQKVGLGSPASQCRARDAPVVVIAPGAWCSRGTPPGNCVAIALEILRRDRRVEAAIDAHGSQQRVPCVLAQTIARELRFGEVARVHEGPRQPGKLHDEVPNRTFAGMRAARSANSRALRSADRLGDRLGCLSLSGALARALVRNGFACHLRRRTRTP